MQPELDERNITVPARSQANDASEASEKLLCEIRTEDGVSLADLSATAPVLLIFLRHSGCTFCRQTLSDLANAKSSLDEAGIQCVTVHMGPPSEFSATLAGFSLQGIRQISDPTRRLYHGLGLQRGRLRQLLGWRVWWRGFLAAIVQRHGVGKIGGDVRQLPGLFLLRHGRVVKAFHHSYSSDRPDLLDFATMKAQTPKDAGPFRQQQ